MVGEARTMPIATRRTPALIAMAALLLGLFFAVGAGSPARAADVEDFSYDRWDVAYEIGLDDEGRAVAHVTETLVARFPEIDQNRGIVRWLPRDYEGAPTDPRDFRVTDENGEPVPFEVERGTDDDRGDEFVAVLTGDDDYVHGRQTYVIEYVMSDVVLARDDGAADEFYWDLVPSARQQPISSFSAQIDFAPGIAEHLTDQQRCYAGPASSGDECPVTAQEGSVRLGPMPLGSAEGATIAIGMDPGTVVQPSRRLPNVLLDVVPLFIAGAALVVSVIGAAIAGTLVSRRRKGGRGIVVAQYEVPPELPPLTAAPVAGVSANVIAAQLVHLAVNGAIRFEEGPEEGGLFSKRPQPVLRVIDPTKARDLQDKVALSAVFPSLEPGTVFALPRKSQSFAQVMQGLQKQADERTVPMGYFTKERSPLARVFGFVALGILVVLTVFVVFAMAMRSAPAAAVIGIVVGAVALVCAIVAVAKHRVYTPLGAEAREHLEGVKLFIQVAEADRLRMLQSYSGAERRSDGSVDVIHLYEKLLPYAMLFGMEKEWGKVLGDWYRANPGHDVAWYPGSHGIGNIGDSVSDVVGSISNAVSSSSSSAGGSTGGGSVGGGGGGGGAGGR